MLKTFFTISIILVGTLLSGQVISDIIPQPGYSFVLDPIFAIDAPGSSGPGTIWDFGDLDFNSEYAGHYLNAQEVPDAVGLPDEAIAMALGDSDFMNYTFLDFSNDSWNIVGTATHVSGQSLNQINYETSHEVFTLPLEFGLSGSGSYQYSYFMTIYTVEVMGNHEWEVDASGTLILPNATYTDVLRIKCITEENEFFEDELNVESQKTTYFWFKDGIPYPLLQFHHEIINEIEEGTIVDSYEYHSANAMISFDFSSNVENTLNQFVSPPFPNPGSDKMNVHVAEEFGQVSAYSVHDLTGKMLMRSEAVTQWGRQVEIDISRLSQGVYTLILENAQNQVTHKFVKQ